jgi:signal transduction histidine kinase
MTAMARRPVRSISLPITLASVSVALSIALLVGWTLVIVNSQQTVASLGALLIASGSVSIGIIMAVLVWFGVFLAREILETQRQTRFVDSVTHELKSPLASLKLCLETQARPDLSDAHRRQLHGMMLEDVERLSVFIEDLLVANRVGGEQRGLTVADVSVAELARRCGETVARRYHLEDVAVLIDVPETMRLNTDATALETVLKNLLDNAVKYSDPPVHVRLAATPLSTGRVQIAITDRGIGIPPKQLKRVFERFYRAPGEAVRARAGTGLGLYVVAALVREMGGRVRAEGGGDGIGTTVVVHLPMGKAA